MGLDIIERLVRLGPLDMSASCAYFKEELYLKWLDPSE